jgi:hypothetical protein
MTWHMGSMTTEEDNINILYALKQKGLVKPYGNHFSKITFEDYEIKIHNQMCGFEISGNDIKVLETLLFLIELVPEYVKMGISDNPHEPVEEELFYPHKGISMEELITGLKIREQYNYYPEI